MTEQETINMETQKQLAMQDAKFNVFMQEMRDRDNQRAAEIRELRQKQDADIKEIRTSIDGMGKQVQNLTVAAVVGIGAAVAGIGAIAVTVMYSVLNR